MQKEIEGIFDETLADEIYKLAAEKNSEIEKLQWKLDKDRIVDWLKSIQSKYGKCFDLIEDEELEKLAKEIIGE
jgi:hypothetical protein